MKKISGHMSILFLFVLLCFLCACKGENALSEYAGSYTLFAYDFEGYVLESADMESVLSLNKNGGGKMTIGGKSGSISEWSMDGESISIRSGEDVISGTLKDGVLTLDFGDGSSFYYAQQGADISGIPVISMEEYLDDMVQSVREENTN